jgi:hypothetical protein
MEKGVHVASGQGDVAGRRTHRPSGYERVVGALD